MILNIFRPHVAFGYRQMAKQITKREFSRCVGPINLVGRDTSRDPERALARITEILQKRLNGKNFHAQIPKCSGRFPKRALLVPSPMHRNHQRPLV
jgi:hypothetical protein